MLLARYADAENLLPRHARLCQGIAGGLLQRVQPLPDVLLAAAVMVADQAMRGRALAQHSTAFGIEHQHLGALGAAVNSKKHGRTSKAVGKFFQRATDAQRAQVIEVLLERCDKLG